MSPLPSSSDLKPNKEEDQTATALPTLRAIDTALKLVDSKKDNLKKAYDHLLLLSSFSSHVVPFSWTQLDSYFSSLHHTFSSRFLLLLNSYDSNSNPNPDSSPPDPPIDQNAIRPTSADSKGPGSASPNSNSNSAPPAPEIHENDSRPSPDELSSVCQLMDGKGLRRYVQENAKDPSFIRDELAGCLSRGREPEALALDAMEGFVSLPVMEKKACVVILEALVRAIPASEINKEAKERARKLGLEWMEMVNFKLEASVEALALLNLVAGFRLAKDMDSGKLVACCMAASKDPSAPALVKEVGLDDSATASLIEKLIEEEKELLAIKFICELGLADKFRPVDILVAFLKEHQNKSYKEGKLPVATKNQIRSKELCNLESAIKIVDEYKLSYPKEDLTKRIAQLEKQNDGESCAPSTDKSFRKQKELEKRNGKKRPRIMEPTGPVPGSNAWRPSPSMQLARFPVATPYALPDSVARYAGPSHYQISNDATRFHLHPQLPYPPFPPDEFRPFYPSHQSYYFQ